MALTKFDNKAVLSGKLDNAPFDGTESTLATVALSDIDFTKEANQDIWINGYLVYTLTVTNAADEGALTNLVITDTLEYTIFSLDQTSFVIVNDGTTLLDTQYTISYNSATGILTITITDPIVELGSGEIMTITFRGTKVNP